MINCYLHTQLLAVQQIGASYICPDNFLCVLNLHVVYQFRMLQNTLVNLWSNIDERTDIVEYSNECYVMLKKCIRKHQSLIEFSAKLDDIYTLPILSHMVIFSVLMCFDTYEVILVRVSDLKRINKNFWRPYYDPQEILVVADCKRICNIFIILMIFCTQGTCAGYMVTPLIANIGRNESDRILPFNLWVDFPVGTSPYFEILFTIQILCVYHVGVCYICFDNLLCIVNLHVASQFRILQHRLRSIDNATKNQIEEYESDARLSYYSNMCCTKLRNCVQQHQMLIEYCKKLENIFTLIVLAQVDTPTSKKASLVLNLCGVLCQLLMFTYSCDDLMRQSVNVGNASFSGPWPILPMNEAGATVRKNLLIIIMRSHKVCCITAGKFFPVSLQTFTGVLSTAMSYFTLLRNTSLDATNS
ncbi:odorant receptor Or2-like [Bombus huntii]|uniref:odorant receptor Or2-like n=1 Tax=Bombus huntii TaxID=85661 RepID=UPI0021AAD154|nr:odorant receptor Or2-like [Bombus huntii]